MVLLGYRELGLPEFASSRSILMLRSPVMRIGASLVPACPPDPLAARPGEIVSRAKQSCSQISLLRSKVLGPHSEYVRVVGLSRADHLDYPVVSRFVKHRDATAGVVGSVSSSHFRGAALAV